MLALSKAAQAQAFEAAAGVAAVEEGDERVRPGAALHLGLGSFYTGRIYYYGREFGPVREETYLLSFNRRWGLFKSNSLTASAGLALMDEKITVSYENAADREFDESEDNYNVGLAFGVAWSLPKTSAPYYLSASWDSHVFPAGAGGLFLATGRKQTVSLTMGVQL